MPRIKTFLTLLLFLLSISVFAIDRKFTGQIVDTDGQPVIGAGLICKENERIGTSSDTEGRFSLNLPQGNKVVVISSLGMVTKEYHTDNQPIENVRIVLEYDSDMLDQVVVTGYSQTTLKRITGSVGIMDAEKFKSQPISSVGAIMQGEVAGVSVQASSGQPGTQSRIRIRGINNISGSSEPLWVIDGVPMQNDSPSLSSEELATGGFDNIFVNGVGGLNPNDIESITILKDAAAAAIYGSRAAKGVIVVTTKRGESGKMKVNYNNNFSWSFKPRKSLNLMNSAEKLDWEEELWNEFSRDKFIRNSQDGTTIYPVVGIVGQIRAGLGEFKGWDKERQDSYIAKLKQNNTNWYDLLFRNAFSHNHHLSLSGGSEKYTYYISGGANVDNGMLINNDYQRFNLNANIRLRPIEALSIDFGIESARQKSKSPDSYVNAFTYAYFANPYERAYNDDGSYATDMTYFSLGYFNGRESEIVMPKNGFNILRELNNNSTTTVNSSNTLRAQADYEIAHGLKFTGLASFSFSNNSTDKIVEKSTYTAFRDRLGNDDKSLTNLYGNIAQNRTNRESYVLRGHFTYNNTFGNNHTINLLAGAEVRASDSNTIFSKRYNYDPVTGTSSLPSISGPADQWLSQVERLNGQYFTDNRYASFYTSADYYLKKTFVFNASFRTDGSSNFGNKRQFNPTWSAGAAWHIGEEKFLKNSLVSHATLRLAYGFTGDVNTSANHLLVMRYKLQEYRNFKGENYMLGTIPSAPNPSLGWEKTSDSKAGLDFGLWKDRFEMNTEVYYRLSSDVVASSQVQSTSGFTYVYFNSADILNSGVETTIKGRIIDGKDWKLTSSLNFAYNYNKVLKYIPSSRSGITAKDRYVEGYPAGAILAGRYYGIDRESGLYSFRLRDDATVSSTSDLNKPDNYRYYLGTTVAPYTGGFNVSLGYKGLKMSISGVYSFGAKAYDTIISPASYLNARHSGIQTEVVQSQFSDLYSNHLNVGRDRTDRWTSKTASGVKYPRIYDSFDAIYNFAASNPMDYSIVNSIYLKDVSYLRLKTILLTYSLPDKVVKALRIRGLSLNMSLNNFVTLTRYDGFDPEIPGATYPTTRSVSFGMNIDL